MAHTSDEEKLTVERLVTYVGENPDFTEQIGFLIFQTDPRWLAQLAEQWNPEVDATTAFLAGAVAGYRIAKGE